MTMYMAIATACLSMLALASRFFSTNRLQRSPSCDKKIDTALRLAEQVASGQEEAAAALACMQRLHERVILTKTPLSPPELEEADEASRALRQLLTGQVLEDKRKSEERGDAVRGFGMLVDATPLEDWDFDADAFDKATGGSCLSTLTFCALNKSGLVEHFEIDELRLIRFLTALERMYPQHPYHNRMHVAEVVHLLHRVSGSFSPLHRLALYFAAFVHDVDHKGVTNDFLVRTQDPLAITYNDESPMENHHSAVAFRLLLRPEMNFLDGLSKQDFLWFRKAVIEVILATDMRHHFKVMEECKTVSENSEMVLMKVALKFADLSHTTRGNAEHMKWVSQLEEEFFQQGDQESRMGLRVSPLMDRKKKGMSASQTKFFDIIVIPLLEVVVDNFDGTLPFTSRVFENRKLWDSQVPSEPLQPKTESLLASVGGLAGVVKAVDRFYEKILADPEINKHFEGIDMNVLRQKQVRFLKHAFGEGQPLDVEMMRVSHQRLNPKPGPAEFEVVVNHLKSTLQEGGVSQHTIDRVLNRLSPMAYAFT